LSMPFTIFWIAGISNAINFIDGMDGLSSGTSLIAALTFGIVFSILGNATSAMISFALFGALVGFLFFNWPPAKIFMGDSGAIFIGFALGALPFLEQSGSSSLLIVCLLISVVLFPVLDTFASMIRRTRRKISVIVPDKEHTHHKLLDFGMSEIKALTILYSLSAIPCVSVIIWAATGNGNFFWLVVATWIIMLMFFIILDFKYHGKERRLGTTAPNDPQAE
ncbi:MAG: undecaprenyl/decaprenyl-phosphate alpha-N-acetylglucosaminyl 1-phosphate transferase, partial [Spirochaetales bacterium]|nr:undecaprenyl/decaprenyl-phosphate alpha-N-acetylglucosaminyl 1-phosphate transferase [Spirochaetales bacterium]